LAKATISYNHEQAARSNGVSAFAGRGEIWNSFIEIVSANPLGGVPRGGFVDMGEYGTGYIGDNSPIGGTGHNVFLNVAAASGVPGALLFALLFFGPIIRFLLTRRGELVLPLIVAHVIVFLVFCNLSVGNWKTYWALFAICVASKGWNVANGESSEKVASRHE
jgi:O-antigen ligase